MIYLKIYESNNEFINNEILFIENSNLKYLLTTTSSSIEIFILKNSIENNIFITKNRTSLKKFGSYYLYNYFKEDNKKNFYLLKISIIIEHNGNPNLKLLNM